MEYLLFTLVVIAIAILLLTTLFIKGAAQLNRSAEETEAKMDMIIDKAVDPFTDQRLHDLRHSILLSIPQQNSEYCHERVVVRQETAEDIKNSDLYKYRQALLRLKGQTNQYCYRILHGQMGDYYDIITLDTLYNILFQHEPEGFDVETSEVIVQNSVLLLPESQNFEVVEELDFGEDEVDILIDQAIDQMTSDKEGDNRSEAERDSLTGDKNLESWFKK